MLIKNHLFNLTKIFNRLVKVLKSIFEKLKFSIPIALEFRHNDIQRIKAGFVLCFRTVVHI